MQYELQKLERMSLEAVREIAESMGLKPRRSQSIREISYAILDAQADNRAAVVQAKEEARAAAGVPAKRERTRGVKRPAAKVNTSNLKSEHVIATVGSEKEELEQMQEQLKANNHVPNRTVQQNGGLLGDPAKVESQEAKIESRESRVESQETKVKSQEERVVEEEAPKAEPKKRGRKNKNEAEKA